MLPRANGTRALPICLADDPERHEDSPPNNADIMRTFYARFLSVRALEVPTIAALNGLYAGPQAEEGPAGQGGARRPGRGPQAGEGP